MTEQVFVLPFEQSLPLHRDPLASCFKAWAAIPAVSSWVLNKIQQGYSLQFSRRLQRCYSNFCSRQRNSRSPTRSTDIACKRCCGNHAPREQRLRLFQLLLTLLLLSLALNGGGRIFLAPHSLPFFPPCLLSCLVL